MEPSTHRKRLFIGIPLPPFLGDILMEVRAANKDKSEIRWTPQPNLHITLHFLGNIYQSEIDRVIQQLQCVVQETEPFSMLFHQYQLAPKKRPYMIWATFLKNASFVQLSKAINTIFLPESNLNAPSAHITLARFKYLKSSAQIELPSVVKTSEIMVRKMTLWESVLKPEGPIYTSLYTFVLGKEG